MTFKNTKRDAAKQKEAELQAVAEHQAKAEAAAAEEKRKADEAALHEKALKEAEALADKELEAAKRAEAERQAAQQEAIRQQAQANNAWNQFQTQPNQTQTGNPRMSNPNPNPTPAFAGQSIFGQYRSPLAGSADTDVIRLIDLGKEILDNARDQTFKSQVSLVPVSRDDTGSYSAVVIAIRRVIGGRVICGVQTLIVEKSRSELEPIYVDGANGQRIEVIIPVAEAFTPEFISVVTQRTRQTVGEQELRVVSCGVQVLPRELEIKDAEGFYVFFNEAVKAITSTLASIDPSSPRFSLMDVKGKPDYHLNAITRTNGDTSRRNGIPVRSDIVSEMSAVRQAGDTRVAQTTAQVDKLVQTCAYTDLIFVGGSVQQHGFNYIPRITITELSTDMANSSLEFALLGLANINILSRNRSYAIGWRGGYNNPNEVNRRDLGAVGLQVQGLADKPAILDVGGSDTELRELMETVLAKGVVYTIEVEQAGTNSWLSSMFAAAALNNPAGINARKALIKAGDNLTGGRFSFELGKRYPNVNALETIAWVTDRQDRNFVGYYTHNGEKRDLREIDLLALLNMIGLKDPELVERYLITLKPETGPVEERLSRRLAILQSILSEVKIKGYSTKYDFVGNVMEALLAAVAGTEVNVSNNNFGLRDQVAAYSNVSDWESVMTNPQAANTLFNYQQNNSGYNGPTVGTMHGFQNFSNNYYQV